MNAKIVAPPGAPPALIGICKVLLGKTGKQAFVYEGFTALIFPAKKIAIIILPGLTSHIFNNREKGDTNTVDYNRDPWFVNVGEYNKHDVSYDPLPEGKDDTDRLFGSYANGEPYLKISGYNNFVSGMNDPTWKAYFFGVQDILQEVLDFGPNYPSSPHDITAAEATVRKIIRSFITKFDAYTYVTTHFPENSIPDALLDFVENYMKVFPTYNGVPIYQGPTVPTQNGNPLWPLLSPRMCRKTPSGEYIIIFSIEVSNEFNAGFEDSPQDFQTPTANDLYLSSEEFAAVTNPLVVLINNITGFYWVAYKAIDVINAQFSQGLFFELKYEHDESAIWFHTGETESVAFSFDSTVPEQDFAIRFPLEPNKSRLNLVQDNNFIIDAQVLLAQGNNQLYHDPRPLGLNIYIMDETPATGCYFPYDLPGLTQPNPDYVYRSVYVQVITADVVQTAISGGYNISGSVQFAEIVNPRTMNSVSVTEWFTELGDHPYELRAGNLNYWEPYKFYNLGSHVGVGTMLNGLVALNYFPSITTNDPSSFRRRQLVITPIVNGDITTTVTWNRMQLSYGDKNRAFSWLSQIVVERLIVNSVTDTQTFTPTPENGVGSRNEITTITTQTKEVYDRYYKKFDIVGDTLVVTEGDTTRMDLSFGSHDLSYTNDTAPGISSTGSARQGDCDIGQISYDINYQEYPGAPEQLGAHIRIPASYVRPQKGNNWIAAVPYTSLHTNDPPWNADVDALDITTGVFKDTSTGRVGVGAGFEFTHYRNPLFLNFAGHTITSHDGDIYRDGQFLFRPPSIPDGGHQLNYQGIVVTRAPLFGFIGTIGFTGNANLAYLWGDANYSSTTTHYTLTENYKNDDVPYIYTKNSFDGSGLSTAENMPIPVMIYNGNSIRSHIVAKNLHFAGLGSDFERGTSPFSALRPYTEARDPLGTFFDDYWNVGRTELLTPSEKFKITGRHINHGWSSLNSTAHQELIRLSYTVDDNPGELLIPVHVTAWLDENQDLKLCFYMHTFNVEALNDVNVPDFVTHPFWLYNEFMTPNAVMLKQRDAIYFDQDLGPQITPQEITTQAGLEAVTTRFLPRNPNRVVSGNLGMLIVTKIEEAQDE